MYLRFLTPMAATAATLLLTTGFSSAQDTPRDGFYWLSEMNKASTVMTYETGIVPPDLAQTIANAVATVIENEAAPGSARSSDYLANEVLLIEVGGPDVSRMHSGRSRQDIGATSERLFLREAVLQTLETLIDTRETLLDFAAQDPHAVVPAYTVGVQAQPITLGHYISGYTQALERSAERLKALYDEVNMSPLGSAALGTSSFPVDRERLSELLGFSGAIENSLDANQLARVDTGAVATGVANAMALTVSTLISDIEAQYRFTTPYLLMEEGTTGSSSIMPQKRNPNLVNTVRSNASDVLGISTSYLISAHNIPHGLRDQGNKSREAIEQAAVMLDNLSQLFTILEFNAERALDEVNADFSTTTELADVLQREADVPFRVGHHFASLMVTYGRRNGLSHLEVPYDIAQELFAEAALDYDVEQTDFPLTEERFREALSPEGMVNASLGLGGPQPAEVDRMIEAQLANIQSDRDWLSNTRSALAAAAATLDETFTAILDGNV